jgi:hypothetical protein
MKRKVSLVETLFHFPDGTLAYLSEPPCLRFCKAYDSVFKLEARIEAGCMAHAWRKFDELI